MTSLVLPSGYIVARYTSPRFDRGSGTPSRGCPGRKSATSMTVGPSTLTY